MVIASSTRISTFENSLKILKEVYAVKILFGNYTGIKEDCTKQFEEWFCLYRESAINHFKF